jgi:DNA (cytosine-5)-methyltransferase 1
MAAYYNEYEPCHVEWLKQLIKDGLIPDGEVDARSIIDVRASDLKGFTQCHFFAGIGGWPLALRFYGWPDHRPVWTGSCPCQPFSSNGDKTAQSSERHLWPNFAGLIRECRPTEIYGEQVDEAIAAGWLDDALSDLEAEKYACASAVLPAYSVGASFEGFRLYFYAKTIGLRLQGPRSCGNPVHKTQDSFREADTFISSVQRKELPYVCSRHDGVPRNLAEIAIFGAGNAIVPQVAAKFIEATQ